MRRKQSVRVALLAIQTCTARPLFGWVRAKCFHNRRHAQDGTVCSLVTRTAVIHLSWKGSPLTVGNCVCVASYGSSCALHIHNTHEGTLGWNMGLAGWQPPHCVQVEHMCGIQTL